MYSSDVVLKIIFLRSWS